MPTEERIQVHPSELAQIVESVFAVQLGLEAGICEEPWFPDEERLTAAVHLTGGWNGAVLLECDPRQACRFTARFLSIDTPDTVDDVVRDTLGELVNMVGGNLKCVLTRGIRVSMPSVVEGSGHRPGIDRRLAFRCAEGLFWITVLTNVRFPGS
jgi:chemotaxis protein CheX